MSGNSPEQIMEGADTMRDWRKVALHALAAGVFMFLLQRFAFGASFDSCLLWATTFGGCAAGLAYMQSNR